jgi:hypothetical protein
MYPSSKQKQNKQKIAYAMPCVKWQQLCGENFVDMTRPDGMGSDPTLVKFPPPYLSSKGFVIHKNKSLTCSAKNIDQHSKID